MALRAPDDNPAIGAGNVTVADHEDEQKCCVNCYHRASIDCKCCYLTSSFELVQEMFAPA
jgi:hypothetical protein